MFRQLAVYVAVVLAGLALQQFVVYSASVAWLGGMRPRDFFRGAWPATLTAFSTASSSATLPTALWVAENELHLPAHVSRFVLTIGSTANQNGTALFEGVTVLFLAQVFGVELTLGQQITVAFICILGGIGTAGVPAGSIPVVAMILGIVGVPPEGIGIVLGVDRLLDMCRTTVNVTGDLAAAVVVSRGEPLAAADAALALEARRAARGSARLRRRCSRSTRRCATGASTARARRSPRGSTLWMAIWWISEALPIHWTACVPLLVLPCSGIHGEGVGAGALGALLPYLNPYIFLFLGGMGIAAAMQQWQLDRRIALTILRAVGTDPRRLLLGVLLATASRLALDLEHRDRGDDVPDRARADRRVRAPGRARASRTSAPRSCWRWPTRRTSAASARRSARCRRRSSRASWRSAASRSPSSSSWRWGCPS